MKEISQNDVYYTTEWLSSGEGWVPDYYADEDDHRMIPAENTTWMIFESLPEAERRLKKERENHNDIPHRSMLVIKSEWLNDELNEM